MILKNLSFVKPLLGAVYDNSHEMARNLKLYWPMIERSGSVLNDVSPYKRTGYFNNVGAAESGWRASPMGGSFYNPASTYFVSTTGNQPDSVTNEFTVSVWVRPSTFSDTRPFFSTRDGGGDLTFDIRTRTTGGNKLQVLIGTGSAWITTAGDSAITLSTSEFTHVVYVVNKTSWTLYINGTYHSSATYASNTPMLWNESGRWIRIGTGAAAYYHGAVDEVRAYGRQLTPEEIKTLYRYPHIDWILPSHTKYFTTQTIRKRNAKVA